MGKIVNISLSILPILDVIIGIIELYNHNFYDSIYWFILAFLLFCVAKIK